MAWSVDQVRSELAGLEVELGRIGSRLEGAGAGTWRSLAADRFRDRLGGLGGRVGAGADRVAEAGALAAAHEADLADAPFAPLVGWW